MSTTTRDTLRAPREPAGGVPAASPSAGASAARIRPEAPLQAPPGPGSVATPTGGRRRRNRRRRVVVALLLTLAVALWATSLMVGRTFYPPA
ncbi:MAG: hypothetical protein ACTHXO_07170, partial [Actinomycetaceae bacterium]